MNFLKRIKESKAFEAGIGYTIGNYLLKGLSFITLPLFSRLMTVEEFGLYNIYISYNEIITILIGLALHSSFKNAKYKFQEKLDSYISSVIVIPIFMLLIFLIFGNAFCDWLSPLMNVDRLILNILIVHSFSSAILICYNSKLSLNYEFKNYLIISAVNSIGNISLSLILMYSLLTSNKYLARVIGTALPVFLVAVYILVTFFHKAHPTKNKEYYLFGLKYSLPVIPHGLSQVILSSSDKIMIEKIVGTTEAGLYSMGTSISSVVRVTTSSLDTVYGPWFYEQIRQNKFSRIKKISSLYIILMMIFVSFLLLFMPEIIFVAGGENYAFSVKAVIPCVASMFFTFLYTLPSTVEYYYEKTWIIAVSSILTALLNILLNFLFITKFGYIAAGYTTLFSYFVYFLIHFLSAIKISKTNFFDSRIVFGSSFFVVGICLFSSYFSSSVLIRGILALTILLICVITVSVFFIKSKKKGH